MANLEFDGKKIYYEVYGEGSPLVLLNGIMMSTLSWQNFVKPLSANNQLILMDFFDQGQSEKYTDKPYNQDVQVEALKALLDHLELKKAAIAGVSYGGNVALKFAAEYPDYVHRLILFNVGIKTNDWLKEQGQSWIMSANDPQQFYSTTIPVIYSPEFYNGNPEWVKTRKDFLTNYVFTNKEFMDGIVRLANSANDYDMEERLDKITAKTLLVGSQHDPITPFTEQEKLHKGIKNSELVYLPMTGHASMYEKPALFISLLLGFANSNFEGI